MQTLATGGSESTPAIRALPAALGPGAEVHFQGMASQSSPSSVSTKQTFAYGESREGALGSLHFGNFNSRIAA
jgi:hypothetical protein